MTPVAQLLAMIRGTSPKGAVGLLTSMPADRLSHVISGLTAADLARLLPAMGGDLRARLVTGLSDEQLSGLAATAPAPRLAALLPAVPPERLAVVANALPETAVAAVFAAVVPEQRGDLLGAMPPAKARAVLAPMYVDDVVHALRRANADVLVPNGAPEGVLLVGTLGRRIAAVARYDEDGSATARDAEWAAYHLRAHAALSVTSLPPADAVVRYCRDSTDDGRPMQAVAWTDARHDGSLKRALVALVQ